MAMRKEELDAQIDHYNDLKSQGLLIEPDKKEMLFRNECSAQSSYTEKYDCKYEGGQIVDVATGSPPPDEIIKAIEGRVKLLAPTMPSIADKYIKQLKSSKLKEE